MKDFRKLKVWGKAHELTLETYQVTAQFPKAELYGLTSQIRRACVSVPANLAEGCGRTGAAEMARFFQIAMGSANELDYHFLLARDLKLLIPAEYESLSARLTEVKRMLAAFIQKLNTDRQTLAAAR